jgi:hypothetical protein
MADRETSRLDHPEGTPSGNGSVAGYIVEMVRRLPPEGTPVVLGSTPVVAFGDPRQAETATLGINPSANEFLERGRPLRGDKRRLATLESLDAERLDQLTDAQIGEVVTDCAAYFRRNPYRRWFDPLDELLRAGTHTSYNDGSVCHLDLVQWATQPIWGHIEARAVQASLLEDGVPHLQAQLACENVRLVLLNGRQVLTQVGAVGLVELEEVGRMPLGARSCTLYAGTTGAVSWLGWSTNLQSSFGVSKAFKKELAHWVASMREMEPAH